MVGLVGCSSCGSGRFSWNVVVVVFVVVSVATSLAVLKRLQK